MSKMLENHQHRDSDSDEDDPDYWHPGNHLDTMTADSVKQINHVQESRIGKLAADSMKHPHILRESRIGNIAMDSMKVSQPAPHHHEAESKFSFHNFGFHPTPFTDLLKTINTMRESYNASCAEFEAQHKKPNKKKGSGTGSKNKASGPGLFDIKDFQKTQAMTRTNHKISQFREKPLKWDMSAPDAELLKELYRSYESDPTGKRIFNLSRDEAKGASPWRPAEFDKDIAPPDINTLSPTFQKMLLQHMDSVVEQVQSEYDRLPQNTQAQSEAKARVGADLANLRRRREELRKGIQLNSQTT